MTNETFFWHSEINELRALLATLPEENLIERMSLNSRLSRAQKALNDISTTAPRHSTRVTFRGTPVEASRGIETKFGTHSAECINDLYTMLAAGRALSTTGPLPNQAKNRLLITNITRGSFGFEFELPPEPEQGELLEVGQAPPLAVMQKLTDIFRASAEADDEQLAEVLEEVPQRAIDKVQEFLGFLDSSGAWLSIEGEGIAGFRYESLEQVKESASRLRQDNRHETRESVEGCLRGVLAESRSFEFKTSPPSGRLIKGSISSEIKDPLSLFKHYLDNPTRADLKVVTVGKAKPRYTLLSVEDCGAPKAQ